MQRWIERALAGLQAAARSVMPPMAAVARVLAADMPASVTSVTSVPDGECPVTSDDREKAGRDTAAEVVVVMVMVMVVVVVVVVDERATVPQMGQPKREHSHWSRVIDTGIRNRITIERHHRSRVVQRRYRGGPCTLQERLNDGFADAR